LTKSGGFTILNHMVQYQRHLDSTFAALSDPTRRGILVRLGRSDASITELADRFGMTLTGMKKHVSVLEEAGLVTTEKVGRIRSARLGPRRLEDEAQWIETYRKMLNDRLNRLEDFLERTREKS
jgi:DNA-binding transcriptional ArsR family regulator